MNDIVGFLGMHQEIRELLLVMGTKSGAALVYDVCSMVKLDRLVLAVPDTELKKEVQKALQRLRYETADYVPAHLEWIAREDAGKVCPETEQMALLLDAPNTTEEALAFLDKKPAYLIGTIDKTKINAFRIWEMYRKTASHIYLVSWEENHASEALDWSKDPDSDLELSIIFPVYRVAAYLEQCIRSVTAWKADYVEYLFVDDGSPDESAKIIKRYAKKDQRIRLLQKKNGGCASARQYGLERAKGRYVGFVDPDDYVDPSMFRKLLARALTGSYEITYCGYRELYESTHTTKEVEDCLDIPYKNGTCDRNEIDRLIAYLRVAIWRGIYLRDMLTKNNIHFYTDLRRFDDLPFKVETFAAAKSVAAVPEYLYYYRMSRPGQDVSADDERLFVHFSIFQHLDRSMAAAKEKAQLDYLQTVKIHTHRYALEKIRPELIGEYCARARKDLLSNFPYAEGLYILKQFASWKDQVYFRAICKKNIQLVKVLAGYQGGGSRMRRKQRQLRKFQKLDQKYGKHS